jgi:hypothetical protein
MKQYPQWFIDMCQDVLDMRDAQQAYFKQSTQQRLKLSKMAEQKVDNGLSHFIAEGIIAHKQKPSNNQPNLFSS